MTKSVLDFDEVAADDALIEAIRSGASIDDVPADDPAAHLLVAFRDSADQPAETPAPLGDGVRRIVGRRRLVASGVAACVMVVAGVGAAVAGDPTAAFTYVFRQGVDLGSRFGSPADNHAQAPFGGGVDSPRLHGPGSPPVRQGSAAAPWVDDGVREPLGYEHQPRDWEQQPPENLGAYSDDDRSTSDQEDLPPDESVPTRYPESDDSTSPPDDDSYDPQGDDPRDESEPPDTYGPTESEPTDPTAPPSSEPSTPTPSESVPTEPTTPTPSESEPTPTTPVPTTSTPTPSPTPPTSSPSEPTGTPSDSEPTGTPSTSPTTTESVPTP